MAGTDALLPQVLFDRGVHLVGSVLWMDATTGRELSFVSHSGVPGIRNHKKILCTDRTARLATRLRRGGRRLNALVCPYGRPFSLGPLRMELLPSGYALGAAQLRVEVGAASVLYTGDLCLRPAAGVEPAASPRSDVLILDASVGVPGRPLPSHREVVGRLFAFIEAALAAGETPVLLCEPVGTAQQVLPLLQERGWQCAVHPSIASANEIHVEFGVPLGPCRRSAGTMRPGEVLLWPSHLWRSPAVRRRPEARFAALVNNPWANTEMAPPEAVFPWVRHASWAELTKFVERVKPKRIYTLKGWEREVAAGLRKLGWDAQDLSSGLQLPLFG